MTTIIRNSYAAKQRHSSVKLLNSYSVDKLSITHIKCLLQIFLFQEATHLTTRQPSMRASIN